MIYNLPKVERTFKLGKEYNFYDKPVKLIKVTRKGFNFLNVESNRCMLKRHLYDRRYSKKDLPRNIDKVNTEIPLWLNRGLS